MSWKISDYGCSRKIELDKATSELKDWTGNKKFTCKLEIEVKPCDPYFWLDRNQEKLIRGPIGCCGSVGWIGPVDPTSEDNRQAFESKEVVVNLYFDISSEKAKELKNLRLPVTFNSLGESIETWSYIEKRKNIPYTCGVYIKEGVNEAYEKVKALKPSLTLEEFVKEGPCGEPDWDLDLVELKIYRGPDKCIKVINKMQDYVLTGKARMRLSLLMCDIEKNIEFIKTIFLAYY